jgi:hypothetical protein
MEVTLIIQSPDGTRTVPLSGSRLSFGRGDAADVRINDSGLSRLHASIYQQGDRIWILDEGSTGGTLVNDHPVAEAGAALSDGDKISIGRYTTLWVGINRDGAAGEKIVTSTGKPSFPPAAIAALVAAAMLVVLLAISVFKTTDVNRSSRNQPPRAGVVNQMNDPGARFANENLQSPGSDDLSGYNLNQNYNWNQSIGAPGQENSRKLYLQMSDAERL